MVSFDMALECFSPAGLAEEFVQALRNDSHARLGSPAKGRAPLRARAVWQDDAPDRSASSPVFGDTSTPPCAQKEQEDDAELAEIEAFADEQARRFMPTIDRRRARRTATASVGRAAQADSINFQMKTSALWQRRGATGGSLGVLGCMVV